MAADQSSRWITCLVSWLLTSPADGLPVLLLSGYIVCCWLFHGCWPVQQTDYLSCFMAADQSSRHITCLVSWLLTSPADGLPVLFHGCWPVQQTDYLSCFMAADQSSRRITCLVSWLLTSPTDRLPVLFHGCWPVQQTDYLSCFIAADQSSRQITCLVSWLLTSPADRLPVLFHGCWPVQQTHYLSCFMAADQSSRRITCLVAVCIVCGWLFHGCWACQKPTKCISGTDLRRVLCAATLMQMLQIIVADSQLQDTDIRANQSQHWCLHSRPVAK